MPELSAWTWSLAAVLVVSVITWLVSVVRRDVSIVDGMWSLMILLCLLSYTLLAENNGPRLGLVIALLSMWAVRLSLHITIRNHGEPEDRRYQEIRRNNQPCAGHWISGVHHSTLAA